MKKEKDNIGEEFSNKRMACRGCGRILLGKDMKLWLDDQLVVIPFCQECHSKRLNLDLTSLKLQESRTEKSNAVPLNNNGTLRFEEKKYEEAMNYFDEALKIDPKYVSALFNKGLIFAETGKNEEAIKYFDKVIKINPCRADIYAVKGLALFKLGKYEEAIKCFNLELKSNPNQDDCLLYKSLSLRNLGKNEEATKYYNRAIKIKETEKKLDKTTIVASLVLAQHTIPRSVNEKFRIVNATVTIDGVTYPIKHIIEYDKKEKKRIINSSVTIDGVIYRANSTYEEIKKGKKKNV
jgi:tetratricopeptide (TPR) repeat protein